MPTNHRARLQVEQLEPRTLMAQTGLPGGLSFLRPPLPAGLVAAAQADQVIPRPRLLAGRIAVENLLEADGTPDNKSRVVLPFTQPVALADTGPISITARRLDPLRPGKTEVVSIPVLTAAVDAADPRSLVLTTGVLLPRGARITLGAGALADEAGRAVAQQTARVKQGVGRLEFTLANRPFRPTDINLFNRIAYSSSTPPAVAPGEGLDEEAARAELDQWLGRKVELGLIDDAERARLLGLYDAEVTRSIIPNPNLRAGLLSLAGTVASAAIGAVLEGNNPTGRPYGSVDFDPSIPGDGASADALPDGSRRIKVGVNLRGEPFLALGALLVHEVMHQDGVNSRNEEVLAEAALTFAWAQQLLVDPALAAPSTILVRNINTSLLALLNSGNASYPRVGLVSAPQVQSGATPVAPRVFVGGNEAAISFDNYIRGLAAAGGIPDIDTSGNSFLSDFVSRVTGVDATGVDFSRTTRDLIDRHQQVIGTQEALRLAEILRLTL